MQILTHPNNEGKLSDIRISEALEGREYHPIRLGGIPIVFDKLMSETTPSKTVFEDIEKHKFCAHSTTNPKDWEVYFGFVKGVPEPYFLMMDDHFSRVTQKLWMDLECSSNLPTTVYAKEQQTPTPLYASFLTQEAYKKQYAPSRNSIIMHETS
jgi:hypothetical protein